MCPSGWYRARSVFQSGSSTARRSWRNSIKWYDNVSTGEAPWSHCYRIFVYALRMLRKDAGLTIVIELSLAIGIGANCAIFNVVDALLLRPLPYPEPDQPAAIWLHSPGIGVFSDWPSPGE